MECHSDGNGENDSEGNGDDDNAETLQIETCGRSFAIARGYSSSHWIIVFFRSSIGGAIELAWSTQAVLVICFPLGINGSVKIILASRHVPAAAR